MSTAAHGGEPGAPNTEQSPRAGGVLLIVEDEESIGRLVKQYVEQDGWRAVWVRSGEEALAELNRHAVRVRAAAKTSLPDVESTPAAHVGDHEPASK